MRLKDKVALITGAASGFRIVVATVHDPGIVKHDIHFAKMFLCLFDHFFTIICL